MYRRPPHLFNHSFHFHLVQSGWAMCCPNGLRASSQHEPWGIFSAELAPSERLCWKTRGKKKKKERRPPQQGKSMKIRRETQALKRGRCSIRRCSAAALCERGSQEMGCSGAAAALAVAPGRWLLRPLPPLVSPSCCSAVTASRCAVTERSASKEGGRWRSRRLCLPLFQET